MRRRIRELRDQIIKSHNPQGAVETVHDRPGCLVQASAVDGVHLDPPEQRKLALAVKDIVDPLL